MVAKYSANKQSLGKLSLSAVTVLIAMTLGAEWQSARASDLPSGAEAGSALSVVSAFDDAAGVASMQGAKPANTATVTRRSRAGGYHDFLRIVWVPPGLKITTLGKPKAKRAFFTATSFLDPPATVDEVVSFVGNYYHYGQDLGVMVCRPPVADASKTDPTLATWPNVLPIVKSDLGDCTASTLTPGEREICAVAERYQDRKFVVYARGLRHTLALAAQMFRTEHSQNALWDDFGIATAFSGLGFAVWGSSTPAASTKPLSVASLLQRSVVPEYLLKNVTLEEANCRCVQVSESETLHDAAVDPAAIWTAGELDQGACRQLPALP